MICGPCYCHFEAEQIPDSPPADAKIFNGSGIGPIVSSLGNSGGADCYMYQNVRHLKIAIV